MKQAKKNVCWPLNDWKVSGKQVLTEGHAYLGTATTKPLAALFAQANKLHTLAERGAKGEAITPEEFQRVLDDVLAAA